MIIEGLHHPYGSILEESDIPERLRRPEYLAKEGEFDGVEDVAFDEIDTEVHIEGEENEEQEQAAPRRKLKARLRKR